MDPPTRTSKETLRGSSDYHHDNHKAPLKPNQFRYAASSMQGRRPSQEDAHICHNFASSGGLPHHALFCVLDGHGGSEASEFASEELMDLLVDTEAWQTYAHKIKPYLKATTSSSTPKAKLQTELEHLLEQALTRAFVELDRNLYLNHHYGEEPGASSAGSTAVAVLLTPLTIVCANLGDSRCVLASSPTAAPKSVQALALSQDHKPTLPLEHDRIVQHGGVVVCDRVDGELAISRALGDFELKQLDGLMLDDYDPNDSNDVEQLLERAQHQKVCAVPEIQIHPRNDTTERFIVLACDGIWDVATNQDCVEWIAGLMQQGQDDLGLICEQVLDKCLQLGSQDNMTMIVVLLEAGQKLIAAKSGATAIAVWKLVQAQASTCCVAVP